MQTHTLIRDYCFNQSKLLLYLFNETKASLQNLQIPFIYTFYYKNENETEHKMEQQLNFKEVIV